jgi:aryl-alcohol dehydrogenase-like predicted oxidoreductase
VGATKLKHLDDAIAAAEIELSAAEITIVEAPYRAHPVKGLEAPRS